MTKPIFLKNGVWSKLPVADPDEIRYIEIYDEHIPLDVDLDYLIAEYEKGHSFAGSCGIKTAYKYTQWASGMLHENEKVTVKEEY